MRFLLLFAFLLCVPFLSVSQLPATQALLLPDSLTAHADAVIREEAMVVRLLELDKMTIEVHRVVTVLNKRGNQHVGAGVGYNNSRKVNDIRATVYNALGKELQTFKKRDFTDVSAVDGGSLYSDSRTLFLNYTPVAYPYTLDFSYELEVAGTAPLPNWYFLKGYRVSTQRSRMDVHYAQADLKPGIQEKNLEGYSIKREEGPLSLRYSVEGIAALRKESYSPALQEIAPQVNLRPRHFSYEGIEGRIDTWSDVGKWVHEHLLTGRDVLPEATKTEIRGLVAGIEDTLQRAKRVYRYVQENTRYISVQVGIGGIQPISAIEVDRVKYGDCKGLSNYTKALLAAVGVPSYYVHVEAGPRKVDFEEDFPDLAQGNHVILAVPYRGELHWIDCTSQTLPFGFLGDFTDDRLVHVIRPDGGSLVRTPAFNNGANQQRTRAHIRLSPEGDLEGSVEIETKGIQYDSHYGLQDLPAEDQHQYYRKRWGHLNSLAFEQIRYEDQKDSLHFREALQIKAGGHAQVVGNRLLFELNAFNPLKGVPDRHRNRQLPFDISRGYQDLEEYRIELPPGYLPEALPEPAVLDTEFGSYRSEVRYDATANSLSYSREILIREGQFPAEKYAAYRDFRKNVSKLEGQKAVLVRK